MKLKFRKCLVAVFAAMTVCSAHADEGKMCIRDRIIEGTTFPLLRQQTPHPDGSPFLCLSDFIRPLSSVTTDTIGLFASSIKEETEKYYKDDPYKLLLVQTCLLYTSIADTGHCP